MIHITYTTEIAKPYVDGIKKCKSLIALRDFIETYWSEIANDALWVVKSPEFNWKEYEKGVKKERRGRYAGDEWAEKYGAILMPAIILFVGMQAQHFVVPDGCVFVRALEEKIIKKNKGGVYYLDLPKDKEAS